MRAAIVVALALLAAGCGGPGGGDPGGRRLHELSADPVFAVRPPGATSVVRTQTPARYESPGFTGGGWHGPSVVVAFRHPSRTAVQRFYAGRAGAAGWRPLAGDRWTKTYADGARATLLLSFLGSRHGFRLAGGIAPE